MENKSSESHVILADCPVQSVTVFVDRAQVTRHCVVRPSQAGEHCLIITGLTSSAEKDSLRLKVVADEKQEDKAAPPPAVSIDEVSVGNHLGAESDSREPERKRLRDALKDLDLKEKALLNEGIRLREQTESLRNYLRGMLAPSNAKGKADPPVGGDLKAVTALLNYHAEKTDAMDARQAELPHLLNELRNEKSTTTAELAKISRSDGLVVSFNIKAVLTVPANCHTFLLSIQYIVKNAHWKPAYDLRYESKQGVPSNLMVTYSGLVTQTTGEEWNDTTISLSTAAPARGGAPPLPPTRIASLYAVGYRPHALGSSSGIPTQAAINERRLSVSADEIDMDDPVPSTPVEKVKSEGVSATYVIDRKCTIPSDTNDHKVTIGMFPLNTEVRFFATPQLEQQAYIQTRAVNTSEYTFLESEKASVFIDGSFIAKTKIQLTSPGETINLFLGVDAAVKVEHRTLKDTTTKGKEGKMLAKKEPSKRLVEYRTIVQNTKATAVEIMVVELLPRANDERIVVEVLQPTGLTTGEELKVGGTMQNKLTNNVVFFRKLNPGEKLELPFSFSVSWPHDAGQVEVYDPPAGLAPPASPPHENRRRHSLRMMVPHSD